MKKIRILALILALLMLPLGTLVACKKKKGDTDGTEEEESGSSQKRPSTITAAIDDGTRADYLCFYTYDNAPIGPFSGAAPYTIFSPVKSANFVFGRRDIGGRKGGYLGIERTGGVRTDAYFDLDVTSLNGFGYTHVVEFDIYLGGGVVNDELFFRGRKGSGVFNDFLVFNRNGNVYAANKHVVYTANQAGEWVNFAVAINDKDRVFDVYVNGIKTLVKVAYSAALYEGWDSMPIDKYRIGINGSSANDTELRIDNFGISSGYTPKSVKGSDVTFTDVYTLRTDLLLFENVAESKQKVLDIYSSNPTLLENIKNGAFDSGKLLMNQALSISKILDQGNVAVGTDMQYDYGVETGTYKYGSIIGGKTFYSDPETGKSFEFRSDVYKEGAEAGKLIVVDEEGMTGNYILEGDASFAKITIIIDNVITYAIYSGGVFKLVSDDTFDPEDPQAIEFYEGAFHGKDYSYSFGSIEDTDGDFISILLTPDQINKTVDFSMHVNDLINVEAMDVAFNYDVGLLTFSHEGKDYVLAYNSDLDEFTLYDPEGSYQLKPPANEEMMVSDIEELALHYQNFLSGTESLVIPVDQEDILIRNSAGEDVAPWERVAFRIYIPEKMVNYTFGLYLHCGSSSYYMVLTYTKSGYYSVDVPLAEFSKVGTPDIKNLTKIEFKMNGSQDKTVFAPVGDSNGTLANDGYDFYIINFALTQEKIAEVEGPKSKWTCQVTACGMEVVINGDKAPESCPHCGTAKSLKVKVEYNEECPHQDQNGKTYLVDVLDPVAPTCESIGYYAKRCNVCSATVIDEDKSIEEALGHDTEGQVIMTQYSTCNEAGYKFQICKRCNERQIIEELPATSHSYVEILNNAAGRMDYQCKNCGIEYSTHINGTLMSGREKFDLLPEDAKYLLTHDQKNYAVKVGTLTGTAAQTTVDNVNINPKYATFISTRVGNDYCFEYSKGDTSKQTGDVHNAYFDVYVDHKFGSGAKFVFELDIMLGRKNADGEYGKLLGQISDRTNGTIWVALFNINRAGEMIVSGSEEVIKLSNSEFTNIAFLIDPSTNTKTVYVNGFFALTCDLNASSTFTVREVRIQYANASDQAEAEKDAGTSYYYNHIYAYKAESPICLVNTQLVEESKGNLGLYESTTPEEGAVAVDKIDNILADKTLYLKENDLSSDYTFGFTLSANAVLSDGTLLKGTKLDTYKAAISADILTVNGGYIYYMGVPIYKIPETGGEVNIKLRCEDYLSRVTVIVNDKEVISKRPIATGDNYSRTDSYIRSYTFCSAVGEYSVKNISFVTTAEAK